MYLQFQVVYNVCVREREGGGMEGGVGERECVRERERESIQNKNILSFKIEYVAAAGVINCCLWFL